MQKSYFILKTSMQVSNDSLTNFLGLLSEEDPHSYTPIVAHDHVACSNARELIDWLKAEPRECHEWIGLDPDEPVKLYFDFDGAHVSNAKQLRETIRSELADLIRDVIVVANMNVTYRDARIQGTGDLDPEFFRCSTVAPKDSDRTKFSMHLIFYNICITYRDLPAFIKKLCEVASNKDYSWISLMDQSLYHNKKASMRTIYSFKQSSTGPVRQLLPREKSLSHEYFARLPVTQNCLHLAFSASVSDTALLNTIIARFSPNTIVNEREVAEALDKRAKCTIKVRYTHPCAICHDTSHTNSHYIEYGKTKITVIKFNNKKIPGCQFIIKRSDVQSEDKAYGDPDYDLAMRFIAMDRFRKDHAKQLWVKNEQGNWRPTAQDEMMSILATQHDGFTFEQRTRLENCFSRSSIVKNLIDILKPQLFSDLPRHMIQFEDGVYDIINRTAVIGGQYQSFSRLKIKMTDLTSPETEYSYKRLLECIERWIPSSDTLNRTIFEQTLAMSILGGHKGVLVILKGEPDAGKSVLLSMFKSLFGKGDGYYGCVPTAGLFTGHVSGILNDMALIQGKRFVCVNEIGARDVITEIKLKRSLEMDITADRKHEKLATFSNHATFVVDSNYSVLCDSTHPSITKRIQTIDFNSRFITQEHLPYYDVDNLPPNHYIADKTFSEEVEQGMFAGALFRYCVECVHKYYIKDGRLLPLVYSDKNTSGLVSEKIASGLVRLQSDYPFLMTAKMLTTILTNDACEHREIFNKYVKLDYSLKMGWVEYIFRLIYHKGIKLEED